MSIQLERTRRNGDLSFKVKRAFLIRSLLLNVPQPLVIVSLIPGHDRSIGGTDLNVLRTLDLLLRWPSWLSLFFSPGPRKIKALSW